MTAVRGSPSGLGVALRFLAAARRDSALRERLAAQDPQGLAAVVQRPDRPALWLAPRTCARRSPSTGGCGGHAISETTDRPTERRRRWPSSKHRSHRRHAGSAPARLTDRGPMAPGPASGPRAPRCRLGVDARAAIARHDRQRRPNRRDYRGSRRCGSHTGPKRSGTPRVAPRPKTAPRRRRRSEQVEDDHQHGRRQRRGCSQLTGRTAPPPPTPSRPLRPTSPVARPGAARGSATPGGTSGGRVEAEARRRTSR